MSDQTADDIDGPKVDVDFRLTVRQWCLRHDRFERAVLYCRQKNIPVTWLW